MFRTYRFSLIYIIILAVLTFFHRPVGGWLAARSGQDFVGYVISGLFLAFFILLLTKTITHKRSMEIGVVLLSMGLLFFLLLSHPMLLFRLTLIELFILGLLVAWEGKKSKSITPFVILLIGALLVELVSNAAMNTHFYYLDVWQYSLVLLSGYLPGTLLN